MNIKQDLSKINIKEKNEIGKNFLERDPMDVFRDELSEVLNRHYKKLGIIKIFQEMAVQYKSIEVNFEKYLYKKKER